MAASRRRSGAVLTSAEPRALSAIARTRTPTLPHLGPAVHRHLRELPSSVNGLSLTQSLLLQILAREPASVGDLWRVSQSELEPMPLLGDTMFLHILNQMGRARLAVYGRSVLDPERPFSDRLLPLPRPAVRYSGVTDWLGHTLQPVLRRLFRDDRGHVFEGLIHRVEIEAGNWDPESPICDTTEEVEIMAQNKGMLPTPDNLGFFGENPTASQLRRNRFVFEASSGSQET